jgi:hypothetical protein
MHAVIEAKRATRSLGLSYTGNIFLKKEKTRINNLHTFKCPRQLMNGFFDCFPTGESVRLIFNAAMGTELQIGHKLF